MKIFTLCLFLFAALFHANSQNILEDHPPKWDVNANCIINSMAYLFPFENNETFDKAAIYFEREEYWYFFSKIRMRYRVNSNYSFEELYMKDTPEMLVKLGDGTILKSTKERISNMVLNANYLIDVSFDIDSELQEKIIKYGIEKVRIAYVFNYLGINRNQIFDAYTKDCDLKYLNAGMFLNQVINADINRAKQETDEGKMSNDF